jgi:hypothetical protein
MSRITISFTRHDTDVIEKIKEIEPHDRSHVIVRILREYWFGPKTPDPNPQLQSPPKVVDEEARRLWREKFSPRLRTQGTQQ